MRVCILGGRGRGKTLGTLGTLESGKSNMSNDLCLFFFFFFVDLYILGHVEVYHADSRTTV